MKKFLALFLVLVMLVSVMPTAFATDGEGTGTGTGEGTGTGTGEGTGTGTGEGTGTGTGTGTGSGTGEGTGSGSGEGTGSGSGEGTGSGSGEGTGSGSGEGTGSGSGEGTGSGSGEGEGETPAPVYVATLSSGTFKMNATNPTLTLVVTKDSVTTTEYSVEWASSNTSVAVASGSGALSLKGKGTTTISATIKVGGETVTTASGSVTVENEATISVSGDNGSHAYSKTAYATLKASLGSAVTDTIDWDFEVVSGKNSASSSISVTGSQCIVDPAQAGTTTVKITATWGNPARTETTTAIVSFYELINASATVKSGITSFTFDQTNVFSSASIDGTSVSATSLKNYSLSDLWSGASYDGIELEQASSTSSVAKITNPKSNLLDTFDPDGVNRYSNKKEYDLLFTCLNKGTFTLEYALYSNGLMVQCGDVDVKVSAGSSNIEYNTSFTKDVVLNEDDFVKFWNKADMDSDLDYVVFDPGTLVGELLTDDSSKAEDVDDDMHFFYKYDEDDDDGVNDYDLDEVVYEPYAKASKAYEETISFTCVGEDDDEVLYGVMVISVGEQVSFTDVKTTDYFYDAVEWAVNKGVTSGTSATTFSPAKTCTRAEVVTFLWRAAGEPDVTGYLPFTDVDDDAYYYDAVLWAYKNDITTGLTSTTFGPHSTVTRGQVVTFLWRAMDEVSVSASNPFNDVKRTDYFYEAVLWAVKNDVTTGLTSTTFGPASGCTRGQIVTFLYRAYEGE